MNPYQILGVDKDATVKEISAAYRALSKDLHPDSEFGSDEKFQELKLAYDVLRTAERRARYDKTGRIDESPITPEAVHRMIATTVRAIITAQRPDGSTDDPDWEDVKAKVLMTVRDGRRQIRHNINETRRKLTRTQKLLARFKPKSEWDPVGDCLRDEVKSLEGEMRGHDDALEMSEEVERVFLTYDYEVGPGPEGQYGPRPTLRRGQMFLGGSPKA